MISTCDLTKRLNVKRQQLEYDFSLILLCDLIIKSH